MRNWLVRPNGVLDALDRKTAEAALSFVTERRTDLLKALGLGWGVFLAMTFTMIVTVRLALAL